jgi:electron transport complex protein RnfD
MWEVVAAITPAAIFGVWYFGAVDTLPQLTATLAAAVLTQAVIEKLRRRPVTIMDGAPWVTGVILGMSLPPGLSVWISALAGAVAIGVFKFVIVSSTGRNLLNPAMAARVLVISEFLAPMTTFPVGVVSGATPLATSIGPGYGDLLVGTRGGSIGETSALLLLLGGVYLLWRGVIRWHLPIAYLAGTVAVSIVLGRDPLFDVLAGATVMTAFFIVTDPTTSPATLPGRLGVGAGAAALGTFIRVTTFFPTGEALAVTLANFATPFLDRVLPTRVYGTSRRTRRRAA